MLQRRRTGSTLVGMLLAGITATGAAAVVTQIDPRAEVLERPSETLEQPSGELEQPAKAFEQPFEAGRQAERADDYESAAALYREGLEATRRFDRLDPRRVEALEALGNLYQFRLGKNLAARPYWEEAWMLRLASGTATDREASSTHFGLKNLYRSAGLWDRLEAFERQWLELLSGSEAPRPDAILDALQDLAWTIEQRRPGDPESVELLERALGMAEKEETRRSIGRTLARLYVERDRADEAVDLLRDYARDAESKRLFDSQEVSNLYEELGEAARKAGRLDLAERALREALAAKSRHLGKNHPHLNRYRESLADLLASQERWDEARMQLEAALTAAKRAWGPEFRAASALRESLIELQRRAAGESEATESLVTCSCTCGSLPDELQTLRDEGKIDEAIALAAKLLATAEADSGPVSRAVADALGHQVALLWSLDTPAAAAAAARRLEILWRLVGPGSPEVSDAADRAQYLASSVSRTEDALRFAEAEVESRQAAREVSGELAKALENLGRLYRRAERYADSVEMYALAVEVYGHTFGEESPEHRDARRYLADALSRAGRHGEAEELVLDLIEDLEPLAAVDRWNSIELDYALGSLGRILSATDRGQEARIVNNRRESLAHYAH